MSRLVSLRQDPVHRYALSMKLNKRCLMLKTKFYIGDWCYPSKWKAQRERDSTWRLARRKKLPCSRQPDFDQRTKKLVTTLVGWR